MVCFAQHSTPSHCQHQCMTEQLLGTSEPVPLRYSSDKWYSENASIIGSDLEKRRRKLADAPTIKSPIFIEYGANLHISSSCFINRDCLFVDSLEYGVTIGEHTTLGAHVQIHSATHSIQSRWSGSYGTSIGSSVTIGKECSIGSHCIVL